MQVFNKAEIISELNKNVTAFNQYISTAYGLPGFLLKIMFGKTNRSSKTFDGLVEKYKSKLLAGGKARGRFVPPAVLYDQKNKLMAEYKHLEEKLIKKINRWREEELDYYVLPHPLLGKRTLREMLFFTIYHNEHHLELLRRRK